MNKRFIRYGIGSSIMLCTGIAFASNWVYVTSKDDSREPNCKTRHYIDISTWKYNESVTFAWSKYVSGPQGGHSVCPYDDYQNSMTYSAWDCSDRTVKHLFYRATDWSGKIESGDFASPEWETIVPDTVGEAEYNFVCAHNPFISK